MTSSASPVASPLQGPTSAATPQQMLQFLILQRLLRVQTATMVEIQAVHGGGLGPTGTVDVLPLVDQVDGAGNAIPHVTLYGRPYVRWAGGENAVILDPQVGDLGLMVFASRDLSAVIKSRNHGPPPSARLFSYADGLYVGGYPNATPTQFIQFLIDGSGNPNGITIQSVTGPVTINGVTIDTSGNVVSPGDITGDGTVTGKTQVIAKTGGSAVHLSTHTHGGVQTGAGISGVPTPGS